MHFRKQQSDDAPDINLIPLIDVLLVMLIFLAATTTFMRQSAVKVILPQAKEDTPAPASISILIGDDGRYAIVEQLIQGADPSLLSKAIRETIQNQDDPVVIISADAMAPHQFVINAMQAARQAGVSKIQFATQTGN